VLRGTTLLLMETSFSYFSASAVNVGMLALGIKWNLPSAISDFLVESARSASPLDGPTFPLTLLP
jgi:hypothetical protein